MDITIKIGQCEGMPCARAFSGGEVVCARGALTDSAALAKVLREVELAAPEGEVLNVDFEVDKDEKAPAASSGSGSLLRFLAGVRLLAT